MSGYLIDAEDGVVGPFNFVLFLLRCLSAFSGFCNSDPDLLQKLHIRFLA